MISYMFNKTLDIIQVLTDSSVTLIRLYQCFPFFLQYIPLDSGPYDFDHILQLTSPSLSDYMLLSACTFMYLYMANNINTYIIEKY